MKRPYAISNLCLGEDTEYKKISWDCPFKGMIQGQNSQGKRYKDRKSGLKGQNVSGKVYWGENSWSEKMNKFKSWKIEWFFEGY